VREGDRGGVLTAIRDLEGRLSAVWTLLLSETEAVKTSIAQTIRIAQAALDLVAG